MKKYGYLWMLILFTSLQRPVQGTTTVFLTYQELIDEDKSALIDDYFKKNTKKIKQLVSSVISCCEKGNTHLKRETLRVSKSYFYEVLLVSILKEKNLFQDPNVPGKAPLILEKHRYYLVNTITTAMEAYAKANDFPFKEEDYRVTQPLAPWTYTQRALGKWEKEKGVHFKDSYKYSQEIYHDFASKEPLYTKKAIYPVKAAGAGVSLLAAFLMSNWALVDRKLSASNKKEDRQPQGQTTSPEGEKEA